MFKQSGNAARWKAGKENPYIRQSPGLLPLFSFLQNAKIYKKIRCLQNSGGPENVYTI